MTAQFAAPPIQRAARAVRAAVADARSSTPPALAARLLEVLAPAVGADGGALLLMDPHTALFWTGAVDRLPAPSCHPFFASELDAETPRTFRRLAQEGSGACALSSCRADDGALRATVLSPYGYGDEVRVVIRDCDVAWGGLSLWRRSEAEPFGAAEQRLLDAVAPIAGAAARDAVLRSLAAPGPGEEPQGALVIEGGVVVEANPQARRLMREIDDPATETYRQLDHLLALSGDRSSFSVVLGTEDGRWMTAHGTALSNRRTVVVLTQPSPADLLGTVVAGASLTAREFEVTRLLCRGLTDTEIAQKLGISAHTAHDHVRSVRGKLGVRNRAEVAARVFADRYLDRFLASATVTHDG